MCVKDGVCDNVAREKIMYKSHVKGKTEDVACRERRHRQRRWCRIEPLESCHVEVAKCRACHVKRRWMSPRATPAMQSGTALGANNWDQACHETQPSVISSTLFTQNESGCRQVPRLPREMTMDVAKCHACHVKRQWMSPGATPATQSGAASQATNGDQAHHQTQPSVISATLETQNEGGSHG